MALLEKLPEFEKPTAKQSATAGLGVTLGIIIVWVLRDLVGVSIDELVASAFGGVGVWLVGRFPKIFGE